MTVNLSLTFDLDSPGDAVGALKLGDGVLLGKLIELFKAVWPVLAPILLDKGEPADVSPTP